MQAKRGQDEVREEELKGSGKSRIEVPKERLLQSFIFIFSPLSSPLFPTLAPRPARCCIRSQRAAPARRPNPRTGKTQFVK